MLQSLSRKDHSPSPTNPRYDQETFLEYYDPCFSQNTIQTMKNIQLFLDVFVLVLLVLIHLYRPGENLSCHAVTHVDL